jgi:hypothetical protein
MLFSISLREPSFDCHINYENKHQTRISGHRHLIEQEIYGKSPVMVLNVFSGTLYSNIVMCDVNTDCEHNQAIKNRKLTGRVISSPLLKKFRAT